MCKAFATHLVRVTAGTLAVVFLAFSNVGPEAVDQVVCSLQVRLQTLLFVKRSVVLLLQGLGEFLQLRDARVGRQLLGLEFLDPGREL